MVAQIGIESVQATIAAGQSLSGAVNLGAGKLRGIVMPAAWTAAALTFQVSIDGTNFVELNDPRPSGIAYSASSGLTVSTNQYVVIDPALFEGVAVIKVRSGTASVPVNQGLQAVLTLVTRL